LLADHPRVRATSLEAALAASPPTRSVEMVEGSWGFRKDLRSWFAPETEDLWRTLAEVESETVRIVGKLSRSPGPGARAASAQLVRELFLLQSSDWPFMVLRGRNAGYARERFWGHRERWSRLASALLATAPDAVLGRLASELFEVDNVFPGLEPGTLLSS
jgi:1,4-alpha-glucan branching enzyme